MKPIQYKFTFRHTDISFVYAGDNAEDAFCNLFRAKVADHRLYTREMMLSYMDSYDVEEIAAAV